MSMLMSYASVDFFVLSFVLSCAYAYVTSEDQALHTIIPTSDMSSMNVISNLLPFVTSTITRYLLPLQYSCCMFSFLTARRIFRPLSTAHPPSCDNGPSHEVCVMLFTTLQGIVVKLSPTPPTFAVPRGSLVLMNPVQGVFEHLASRVDFFRDVIVENFRGTTRGVLAYQFRYAVDSRDSIVHLSRVGNGAQLEDLDNI